MLLSKCVKSPVSGDPSRGNMAIGFKDYCNLNDSTFTIFINDCKGNCVGKNLFIVRWKIVRLFVKVLTSDDKHYLLNRDNLTQPIQMQLSKKQKKFSRFFFHI